MAKWTLPEGKIYTQADLDAAATAALREVADAVWEEYQDSVINKWTFRKEHVQNAIAKAAAIRAQGET